MAWFETVVDLERGATALRALQYGVIEIADGQLVRVRLRPWPKFVWLHDPLLGDWYHRRVSGNRCWLYYNQPRRFPNFLALKYLISARGTTFGTFRRALEVLDQVAEIKRSDAILCDAANFRISPRLLARWGWQAHTSSRWHRNYIKRFYGVYAGKSEKGTARRMVEVDSELLLASGGLPT